MALTSWVPTPRFEEYEELFREHFEMEPGSNHASLQAPSTPTSSSAPPPH
jgi:hypothetical protein